MKLIIRADDVGYTDIANIGTFHAIDADIISNVDVMLDCPGTEDALKRLREKPWLSLGWHSHDWGRPVTDPKLVPSLIDERGFFKWTVKNGPERPFGTPKEVIDGLKNQVDETEILLEYRNQVERCIRIYGRAPYSTSAVDDSNKVDAARKQVCDEYGIIYDWFTKGPGGRAGGGARPASPRFSDRGIFMPWQGGGTNKFMRLPNADEPERYDVVEGFRTDGDHIMDKEIVQVAFHPGYVDNYIMYDGGLDTSMTRIRVMDVHMLCSPEMKQWIIENKVELVNAKDAVCGTQDFQNYLRASGSPLWCGNF